MKTIFTLSFITLFLSTAVAQVDMGFKYQAVAMDEEGNILRDQELILKLTLLSDVNGGSVYYEEEHILSSNKNGIINTVIGKGKPTLGNFKEVPWRTKSVWIHVAMDTDLDREYDIENYTQLLAVPYALYALEADKISKEFNSGNRSNGNGNGNDVYPFWTVDGNELDRTHEEGRLGTINERDLIFITSDIERGRIYANGDVEFYGNFIIGTDLIVSGIGRFNNTTNSTSKDDGALIVEGGVGIEKDVNIGGNIAQDDEEDTATLGQVFVTNTTNSDSKDEGALVVEGGVGVEKDVTIGGDMRQDDPDDFATLGQVNITNTTNSTSKDDGSLVVEGGVGIEMNLNVGGELQTGGDLIGPGLIITDVNRTGSDGNWGSYPVQIDAKEQGIAIKLDEPDAKNNFITFFDENYDAVGRIEGQTKIDILESEEWIVETTFQSAAIASSIGSFASQAAANVNLALDVGGVVVDLVNHTLAIVGAAFGSVEAGAGVGDLVCVTAIAAIDLTYSSIQLGGGIAGNLVDMTVTAFDAATNVANMVQYQILTFLNSGSTFSSGSADYAEYLPKINMLETFYPGDVVGVVNGKITKDISQATQLMVISSDPLVLGNMPLSGDEQFYEKVAFMGQVPVKVKGAVNSGDYLIADEENPGFAKAVSPKDLTLNDCKKIVGISWGSSELKGTNFVNTAIGLNNNDVIPLLENQVKEMEKLKVEMNEIKKYISDNEALLSDLVPGYAEAKAGRKLDYDEDLLAAFNRDLTIASQANLSKQLEINDLFGIIQNYQGRNGGVSSLPMDHSQTISMLNMIDSEHNLDLSLFGQNSSTANLNKIEDMALDILNTDYVAEFKEITRDAVSEAVQVVANEILSVKRKLINEIASGPQFTSNEKMMLQNKINEILPIFGLMENSGQIVNDILGEVFELIDEATCEICDKLDELPVTPDDIVNAINVPVDFFIETVDFFVGSLSTLSNVCIKAELCFGELGCEGFRVCPFGFLPDINFNVDDMPFVENKKLQIQFPNLCKSVNCN
ncbi:hypothetical protein [Portibacter marinus]|uniref:hypothetical protein n=1 Tax=Portibacter marinus TaxID=2898660 RepID=UPI001F2B8DD2|nr:hypothetical protein [Portibacter marinus]